MEREMDDLELIALAQAGDPDAIEVLSDVARRIALKFASDYKVSGMSTEDLAQVAVAGSWVRALRSWRPEGGMSFYGYTREAITKGLYSAIKSATCAKHQVLNHALSLDKPAYNAGPDDATWHDRAHFADPSRLGMDPADAVVDQEERDVLRRVLAGWLSDKEMRVAIGLMEGRTYAEIADALHCHTKSIDNAIQRLKRKGERIRAALLHGA